MATVTVPAAPLTYAQLVRLREKLDEHSRHELIDSDLQDERCFARQQA